jgi:thioredoxin reductase (NADPH)
MMSEVLDLAVVGAGPCGIAVGAAAAKTELRTTLFDKGCVTSSLVDYPYYMTFFSTSRKLEIAGVPFATPDPKPTRREALAYYRRVVDHYELDVRQYESVTEICGEAGNFTLTTEQRGGVTSTYRAKALVVAIGGFHEPNLLGVPGEDLDKVLHYYQEPWPFYEQKVLVVGAGNSSVESALECYRAGSDVCMVHFEDKIDRGVKPWVVPDITNRIAKDEIPMYWRHRIVEIRPRTVVIQNEDTGVDTEIENDFVLAMTGWRPNHAFIQSLGVEVDAETGIPHHDRETMATNVPGIYIAGVLAAGFNANKIFIENGKLHGPLIVDAVRG